MVPLIDRRGKIAIVGRLSWANFIDWLVTICLGVIILLTTVSLGGVRPDTHVVLLPLFVALLVLHGLWLAVDEKSPKRLSHIPLWFLPGLLWMLCSLLWWSPVSWRGWSEMIYALEAFIVLWVISNNVRSREHLGLLILACMASALVAGFSGAYQVFQQPDWISNAMMDYSLTLNQEFLGRVTGTFADPNSFAALLLIFFPCLLFAGLVRRLPKVLRFLSLYFALIFFVAIAFTQSYWAFILAIILMGVVPWFCFSRLIASASYMLLGVLGATLVFSVLLFLHPHSKESMKHAIFEVGEDSRLVIWSEALSLAVERPIAGVGAGAYGVAFEQSPRPRVAMIDASITPHNDYLLVLSQLGLLGVILFGAPSLYVGMRAFRLWRNEPFAVRRPGKSGRFVSRKRFMLSIGLVGAIAFGLCMTVTFIIQVPALALYGMLILGTLIKISAKRQLGLSRHRVARLAYLVSAICLAWSFYALASNKLEAEALELKAHQQLEQLVDMRIHVSDNTALLDEVVTLYESALLADPQNADAWIGHSMSVCLTYYRNPGAFEDVGSRAVSSAEHAVEIAPKYWKTWAQLGVARSLYGDVKLAEQSLLKALKLAPNNSNAHYYYAAFLNADQTRREEALSAVQRALEINPDNASARRLQKKILIL